jgi:hypothetical protein
MLEKKICLILKLIMTHTNFGVFNRVIWDVVMDYADPNTWSTCSRLNKNFSSFLDQKVQREEEDLEIMAEKGREWHIWKLYSRKDLEGEIRLLAKHGLYGLVRMLGTEKNKDDILYEASAGGHVEIVKWVVEKGATDWDSALFWTCDRGQMKMAKWLVEKGATDWNRALFGACTMGRMEIAKWLAKIGATDWDSALSGACERGQMEMAKWLVEKGATECRMCKKPVETHL